MQTITGQRHKAGEAEAETEIPNARRHPFTFMHHEDGGWELINLADWEGVQGEDFAIVPKLRYLWHSPGVNGVRQDQRTRQIDPALAIVREQADGWTVIPESAGPDGSYIQRFEDRRGRAYMDAWTTWSRHRRGWAQEFDRTAYMTWRLGLVDAGVIKAPTARAIRLMIENQKVHLKHASKRKDTDEIEQAEGRLACATSALDKVAKRVGRPRKRRKVQKATPTEVS